MIASILTTLAGTSQFMAFLLILCLGFTYIVVSGMFSWAFGDSGDGDSDGDVGDHSAEHTDTISIFSPKVVAIFFVGFGAAGALATHYGLQVVGSTIWAFCGGLGFGLLMLVGMRALYRQQSCSNVLTNDSIGKWAKVTIAIPSDGTGEVGVSVNGQYMTYHARSHEPYPRDYMVKIQSVDGSLVTVGRD